MSIGGDIKEVLQELGTIATIRRLDGSIFQERVDVEVFPDHSSEFIRQFFAVLTLPYDTSAVNGDAIDYHDNHLIATNILAEYFENEAIVYNAAMFKCNTHGVLKRFTTEVTVNYTKTKVWTVVTGNPEDIHALQYENKTGNTQLFAEDMQGLLKEDHVLILQSGLDIAVGDRWYPDYTDESVYYRIDSIETRRLSNCPICGLAVDTR